MRSCRFSLEKNLKIFQEQRQATETFCIIKLQIENEERLNEKLKTNCWKNLYKRNSSSSTARPTLQSVADLIII